jgi:hypothetical protein
MFESYEQGESQKNNRKKKFISIGIGLLGLVTAQLLVSYYMKKPPVQDNYFRYKSLTCDSSGKCWDAEKQEFIYKQNTNTKN